MNLHEYQAKQLFTQYGIPVPEGKAAFTAGEAVTIANDLGGNGWVVKAQVHAGGRGKAGGVKIVHQIKELPSVVDAMLGTRLVTKQTSRHGLIINSVIVETLCESSRELYIGAIIDRARQRIVIMASEAGGMGIEEVAAANPKSIVSIAIDPIVGFMPYQARYMGFKLDMTADQVNDFQKILSGLCRLFIDKDASLVEINPLVVTKNGKLLAMDAKINLDDNALYRQSMLAALRDASQEDEKENQALQFGLNYISLEGNIGCMVNGAGLAMATMDLIKLHGGEPANFLDVGGGTTADKVAEAFKLILSDKQVKAVLVNIFGGIVRCDLIAEGIIKAVKEIGITIPVVARLEGTNVEQGRALLANSGLAIIAADSLTDAAQKAVRSALKTP